MRPFGLLLCLPALAQTFDPPKALEPAPMAALARQVLSTDALDPDPRFRLQILAGDLEGALATMRALRAENREDEPARGRATRQHELYVRTRQREGAGEAREEALRAAFAEMAGALDDRHAYQFNVALRDRPEDAAQDLERAAKPLLEQRPLAKAEALALLRAYEGQAVASLQPQAMALMEAEEARRYIVEAGVPIRTKAGITLCAVIVRPRSALKLPTAFEFTVYVNAGNRFEAVHSASEGFVGVVANSRGKGCSPGEAVPYEHDGEDAAAVIDWIAAQPWSDGKVGMYGGSYDGFTQWAAAKRRPEGLKAIMPCVPVAPGIDVPMQNGIFQNFTYRWIPYVTATKGLDEADYGNWPRWNGLDWRWFGEGRPYRDLPVLDGRPNPLFLRWLGHPTYDAYWQRMIPFGDEFRDLALPVLTVSGYFDGCLLSADYYFREHTSHRPQAEHYLVLGPYDHLSGQRRSYEAFQGYVLDPAAKLDVEALRYQWLDHVLRGGPRPALLADRVNVQVMGADRWRHAPTLEALASTTRTFHLADPGEGGFHRLDPVRKASAPLVLRVDFKERQTLSFGQPAAIEGPELDTANSLAFASAPLEAPLEVDGAFSGQLALRTNKRDVDLSLQLLEQKADGRYLLLSYHTFRASLLRNRTRRQLLVPGRWTLLPFRSGRPVSRLVQKGSRLVFLVTVLKQPRMQVNYGTGRDVSGESMKDAGAPLRLELGPRSCLVLPVNP